MNAPRANRRQEFVIDRALEKGVKLAPTHLAAIRELRRHGKVECRLVSAIETRAFKALIKKGFVLEVFGAYSTSYYTLALA